MRIISVIFDVYNLIKSALLWLRGNAPSSRTGNLNLDDLKSALRAFLYAIIPSALLGVASVADFVGHWLGIVAGKSVVPNLTTILATFAAALLMGVGELIRRLSKDYSDKHPTQLRDDPPIPEENSHVVG